MAAVLLLALPYQWVCAMLLAAAFHECSHLLAVTLLGGEILSIRIGARGAVIEIGELSPWKELLCALAGPLGSATLLLTARWFPRLAICGLAHCVYNLLPLFPLDGGRALRGLIYALISQERADSIWHYSQLFFRIGLTVLIIWLSFHFGMLVLILTVLFLGNPSKEKSLANRAFWRYNRGTIGKGVDI